MLADYLMEGLSVFPKEVIDAFVDAANYSRSSLKFEAWSPEVMEHRWGGKRSLNQIKDEGVSNYLYNCLDSVPLAVERLVERGYKSHLVIVTAKDNVTETREGRAPHHHFDVFARMEFDGQAYGLNMGCGDFTFLKPISAEVANPFLDSPLSPEETGVWTSRPQRNERIWKRVPIFSMKGKALLNNPDTPLEDFFGSDYDLVRSKPYGLTLTELQTVHKKDGLPSIFEINQRDYDPKNINEWNKKWYNANKVQLPSLEAPTVCV